MKKYKQPPTSAEFQSYTREELLLEFLEDLCENNPEEFDKLRVKGEVVEFSGSGDKVVDDLIARIDRGEDLGIEDLELLDADPVPTRQILGKGLPSEYKKQNIEGAVEADEFSDDYTDLKTAPRR